MCEKSTEHNARPPERVIHTGIFVVDEENNIVLPIHKTSTGKAILQLFTEATSRCTKPKAMHIDPANRNLVVADRELDTAIVIDDPDAVIDALLLHLDLGWNLHAPFERPAKGLFDNERGFAVKKVEVLEQMIWELVGDEVEKE